LAPVRNPGAGRRDFPLTAALVAPAVFFLLAFFVLPLLQLLRLSFASPEGPLAAYREVMGSAVYQRVFFNTVILAVAVTLVSLLLSFPTAFVLSRLRGPLRAIAFYSVLVPFWISLLVRTYSWMLLLGEAGPINKTLTALGLTDEPLALLFNRRGVVIGMVHVLLPYAVLPIYAAMVRVDERLLLASDGLGAPLFVTFRRVYLPLTLPGVGAAAVFVFLLALGFFVTPALLGGIGDLTVATLIENLVSERLEWTLAAAAAFALLATVLALLLLASRFVRLGAAVVKS
jgi:putative spermidine/putrescine transport system permease protein